jgi:hypothetical protein
MQSGVPAHTDTVPVGSITFVVDAHECLGWPVLDAGTGWKDVSRREREIVSGTDENAPAGMCLMERQRGAGTRSALRLATCRAAGIADIP